MESQSAEPPGKKIFLLWVMSKNVKGAKSGSTGERAGIHTYGKTRKRISTGQSLDASAPLRSVRHERFAQEIAAGKTASEAYRLAGFKGREANKRGQEIRTIPDIDARIAVIRAEMSAKSQLTKERAMQLCAELAEGQHGAEPHHRISAMEKVGKWCGWESGTQAEQAAAAALGGVADMMKRIRSARA